MNKRKDSVSDNASVDLSRRTFLTSAAGGSAAIAAAAMLPTEGLAIGHGQTPKANRSIDGILYRYGSEFGDIRVRD